MMNWLREYTLNATQLVSQVHESANEPDPIQRALAVIETTKRVDDRMVDAVVDDDRSEVLGGRGWIRRNMTAEQALILIRQMTDRAARS